MFLLFIPYPFFSCIFVLNLWNVTCSLIWDYTRQHLDFVLAHTSHTQHLQASCIHLASWLTFICRNANFFFGLVVLLFHDIDLVGYACYPFLKLEVHEKILDINDNTFQVSYKWLSRNFLVSSNTAKRLEFLLPAYKWFFLSIGHTFTLYFVFLIQ